MATAYKFIHYKMRVDGKRQYRTLWTWFANTWCLGDITIPVNAKQVHLFDWQALQFHELLHDYSTNVVSKTELHNEITRMSALIFEGRLKPKKSVYDVAESLNLSKCG